MAAIAIALAGIFSCSKSGGTSDASLQQPVSDKRTFTFNTGDKEARTNGNIKTAVEMFDWTALNGKKMTDLHVQETINVSAAVLTRQPLSYIGKVVKIRGTIYRVEETALPGRTNGRRWTELLLLTQNRNSPLGVATIDVLFDGDASDLRNDEAADVTGYFCGTTIVPNALGGQAEAMMLVSSAIEGM